MKKPSFWAAILGGLVVAGNLLNAAQLYANPTSLTSVNVALYVQYLVYSFLGAFFALIYFKGGLNAFGKIISDDEMSGVEGLSKKRDWILAFVLLLGTLGSMELWILNDYAAGATLLNLQSIFDLAMNFVFAYLIVQLFRGAKPYSFVLWTVIIYGTTMLVFFLLREQWFAAFLYVVWAGYILYAIKEPVSKAQFRTAHLILLPLFIILSFASQYFDTESLTELNKKRSFLEQQFANDTSTINGAYMRFLTREDPDAVTIEELSTSIEKRDATIGELRAVIADIQTELTKQPARVSSEKYAEQLRLFLIQLDINTNQTDAAKELISLAHALNFSNLSPAQTEKVISLKEKIESYNRQLAEHIFMVENAHIEN